MNSKITLSLSKVRQFGNEAFKCTSGGSGNDSGNGDGTGGTSEVIVDASGVSTTISEGDPVEGGTSYSFDSTTSSTSSDASISNAESASPAGTIDEVIIEQEDVSPF